MFGTCRFVSMMLAALVVGGSALAQTAAPPSSSSAAAPADKSAASAVQLAIPVQFESAVHDAETLGKSLFERDRAAEKATDALIAAHQLEYPAGEPAGWLISDRGGGNYHVSFLVTQSGVPKAYAEADYSAASDSASNAHAVAPPRDLEPAELAQARAIKTAQAAEFLRCVATYNVVVIPSGNGDGKTIHVYLIPSRNDAKFFPEGGFHDFTISADGTTVQDHYSQTKSCLNGTAQDSKGKLAALMMSHITSPTPTAFHVFMNLNYRLDVFTVTVQNNMLWSISGGRIRVVSEDVRKK